MLNLLNIEYVSKIFNKVKIDNNTNQVEEYH